MIKGQYDESRTHFRDLRKGGGLKGSDEFFTRYSDIEQELEHYPVEQFQGKRVLCPCDSPDSNFVRFFVDNFARLGIKHLTATSIDGQRVDYDGVGIITSKIANGDVFGEDVQSLLKETDIVCTNPPFSKKIDFLKLLLDWGGKFLFVGPLIGISTLAFFHAWVDGKIRINGTLQHFLDRPNGNQRKTAVPCRWFTNMTRETTPRPIPCVPYSDDKAMWAEQKWENEPLLVVDKVKDIPLDYYAPIACPVGIITDLYDLSEWVVLGGVIRHWGVLEPHTVENYRGYATVDGKSKFVRIVVQR